PYDFDQMTQHPPGYYALLAVPTKILDLADHTPASALLSLRLLSAALLLPLPYLVLRLAREIGVTSRWSAAAAFLPLALPQFLHIGGAVNSDTLMVTLGTLLTLQAVRLAQRGATL